MRMRIPKLILLLLACLSLSLAACNNDKSNPIVSEGPSKLATPANLQVAGVTLTWNSVQNASGYKVEVNGTEYNAAGAIYSLFTLIEPGETYQIRVMARGNATSYTDSDWSAVKSHAVPVPEELYELSESLEINVGIVGEDGNELGVITKDVLKFLDQVEVTDPSNPARYYVSYSMTEIFAYLGISSIFDSAFLEASDLPLTYNTTVTSFDNAYFAVVRINDDGGEYTVNFPRFIAGDGFVGGDPVLSNVGKITLGGGEVDPGDPGDPGDPVGPGGPSTPGELYDLPGSLIVNIEVSSTEAGYLGDITKEMLASIEQVEVVDPQDANRRYVAYPLTEILEIMGISDSFSYVIGEADDGYWATGTVDDAYITVVRRYANGDIQEEKNFPRFLVPSGEGFRAGDSTVRAPVVNNVTKILLGK